MSDSANQATAPATGAQDNQQFAESKGKGKAAAQDTEMKDNNTEEEDDDESDEAEEEAETVEEADEDNMEEINLDNVIGRRTRGKVIDFAKAAQENPADAEEDSEDDEDFEVEDSRMDED
ncbi:hypothetical protein DL546_008665 [Coniochaeta pulveracea]|uniref:Histone chaperone domain-containing protein n=1 Tax=Coniochaeta pulveracea TaxID=177199 RepID=A0A420YHS7_9PEZI|nr:hypothetical protein DL546_008665 [Coniochaeta pulveracea]